MIVCVTGISGVGKTTILKILSKKFVTKFLDKEVHKLYEVNEEGYNLIKTNFGNEYVTSKRVNRKKLGKLVFTNPKELKKLNKIILPIIKKLLVAYKKEYSNKILLIEGAAILYQYKEYAKYFDKFILITAPNKRVKINNQKKFKHIKNDIKDIFNKNMNLDIFNLKVNNNKTPKIAAEKIENYLHKICNKNA